MLLRWFHFGEAAFHTGWFLESLATQTLVLFVIRTAGRPWSNRPSSPLMITTLLVIAIGGVLPFTPAAGALGFTALPPSYFLFVTVVVGTYLGLVGIVKHRVIRRLTDRDANAPRADRAADAPRPAPVA